MVKPATEVPVTLFWELLEPLEDGSGLSPDNRLTTSVLTDVLLDMRADALSGPELLVALPVAGRDGTLKSRLEGTRAERLVRAKTGRLARAVSLSGYAPVAPGVDAVFAIFVNDYSCPTWKVQDAVDALVVELVADAPIPDSRTRRSNFRSTSSLESEARSGPSPTT